MRRRARPSSVSPNTTRKAPTCSQAVLGAPVRGSVACRLAGAAAAVTVGPAVVGGGVGVWLSTADVVVVVPGSVVVVDDVVEVEDVLEVEDVVELDDVVGASVVVVEVVDVDDEVVGASVVDVVEVEVVEVDDVVGAVPPAHVCERLNFGLPPLGVITADEPETTRLVSVDPLGTATNTLSCWLPFGMIEAPPTSYAGFEAPRFRVIDTNANEPSFGAITKCQ